MKIIAWAALFAMAASPVLARPALECSTASATSGVMRSPTVEADVPDQAAAHGFVITGGGCELAGPEPGAPGGRPHNGPITASKPTAHGWYCRAMDPPNIPEFYAVTAHVIFCRLDRP